MTTVTKPTPSRDPVVYFSTRQCQGECRKRRSATQFEGDSKVCKMCALRMPK